MDKFWKIVAVVAVVESQEHRPLVLSGQDGGSKKWTKWKNYGLLKFLTSKVEVKMEAEVKIEHRPLVLSGQDGGANMNMI